MDRGGIEPPTFALRTRHYTPKPPALILLFKLYFYLFSISRKLRLYGKLGTKNENKIFYYLFNNFC